jgi:NADH:ubiquinone oxidoreductase subunit D
VGRRRGGGCAGWEPVRFDRQPLANGPWNEEIKKKKKNKKKQKNAVRRPGKCKIMTKMRRSRGSPTGVDVCVKEAYVKVERTKGFYKFGFFPSAVDSSSLSVYKQGLRKEVATLLK